MDSILPLATASSTQTVFITSTGIEKWLTLFGASTIALLALFGLFTLLRLAIRNGLSKKS